MGKLDGKIALVTGSSRGIGQQVAVGLAKEGARVIIHGRRKENAERTAELLKPFGGPLGIVEGELESEAQTADVIRQVKIVSDRIDILYNNAAVSTESRTVYTFRRSEWEKVMNVNLYSMVELCSAFAPGMKERHYGRIVNVSSGIADQPNLVVYSVSKAAVDKYTKDLAFDLKGTGVLANMLDPGWLRTDLGGPHAPNDVRTVLPGALVPVLEPDNGRTGEFIRAQDYRID